MKNVTKFWGSKNDLDELRRELTKAGFEEHDDHVIHASENPIPPSLQIAILIGIGKCVKHFLKTRGKRMVTRLRDGEITIIKGDFTAEEIERLLKTSHGFDIQDDMEKPADPQIKA